MQDGKLEDLRTVESIFLILTHPCRHLSVALHNSEPDHRDDVRTWRTGYQPCMQGILHGCRDGSVWSAPQQSQTSNHDHLACETVTGDGTRLQLVLDPRTGASSSVFPLDGEHRSSAPLPPTALSQHALRPAGSPLVTDVFPNRVTAHRRHLPTRLPSPGRRLSKQLEFQSIAKKSTTGK